MYVVNSNAQSDDNQACRMGFSTKHSECRVSIGHVYSIWESLSLSVTYNPSEVTVHWDGRWYSKVPGIKIRIPGTEPITMEKGRTSVKIKRKSKV